MLKSSKILAILSILLVANLLNAQSGNSVSGTVYDLDENDDLVPLEFVTVFWANTNIGTTTKRDGTFLLAKSDKTDILVFSYVGFLTDSMDITNQNSIEKIMIQDVTLDEITIREKRGTTEISFINPLQVMSINEEELCKAACCSLSESFETNPVIDVSFTDAVTGTRQIQMLGLAGKYVQITRELIPDIRGLSAISGFTHTPGAWIESIQLNKGTGSVINGYESLVGQINVEYRKPETKENTFVNLYGNLAGRFEANIAQKYKFNDKFTTMVLLHANKLNRRVDGNKDGFLDMALTNHLIGVSRWKFAGADGYVFRLDFKATDINTSSGQMDFDKAEPFKENVWGLFSKDRKYEINLKTGKGFKNEVESNIGFQFAINQHKLDRIYGKNNYLATQKSLFSNVIYQQNLKSNVNVLTLGASFILDNIEEEYLLQNYDRIEKVPGIFSEYTYTPNKDLAFVAGLRIDKHNLFDWEITPRFHFKYAITEKSVVRLTAGKGWRTANIFAENVGIFASGREVEINGTNADLPYGLENEIAYNFGGNLTQKLYYGNRSATLSLDYYYTMFQNRIIADKESAADGTIVFENQKEINDGHSTQIQVDSEIFDNFDVRIAYRYNINKSYFGDEYLSNPLNPFHRAFINLGYKTKSKWHFDLTLNWRGKQRIPNTDWLPEDLQMQDFSETYFLANGQVRKIFNDKFEMYLGVENMFNYKIPNPIVSASDPFSENFDASLVWGPVFGRNIYTGLRFRM